MKNTTKQFNTHFNFAILAIITVGFLLWHSIAIFNLEQELQSLQSNTAISKKASIQKDDTQGTETENTDTEILYNEDGSIDTSNWKTYINEEYGFSVKYPEVIMTVKSHKWASDSSLITSLSKENSDRKIVIDFSMNDLQSNKAFYKKIVYKEFSKKIKIGGKEGIMYSYGSSDVGKINRYSYPTFGSDSKIETHNDTITNEIYKKSAYSRYEDFLMKKCTDISFRVFFEEFPDSNEGVRQNSIYVSCQSKNEDDAKILLSIFNSITFKKGSIF